MARWIYFSPHFDDAVWSAGGLVAQQVSRGEKVEVWTVCASPNPYPELSEYAAELHARWQAGDEAVTMRAVEDKNACASLGAGFRHLQETDCIYRRDVDGNPLVTCDLELFLSPRQAELFAAEDRLAAALSKLQPEDHVVGPLGMGNHRDHQLTRQILEKHISNLYYYADYPYVALYELDPDDWTAGMQVAIQEDIDAAALSKWEKAIASYESQITSFWANLEVMRDALKVYHQQGGGSTLWQKII